MELQDNIFYTPSEFAKLRNCSVPTALSIYNLQDFPSENFGKEKVALGSAIREWYKKKEKRGITKDEKKGCKQEKIYKKCNNNAIYSNIRNFNNE